MDSHTKEPESNNQYVFYPLKDMMGIQLWCGYLFGKNVAQYNNSTKIASYKLFFTA